MRAREELWREEERHTPRTRAPFTTWSAESLDVALDTSVARLTASVALEMFAVGQFTDEIEVCGKEIVVGKSIERRPAHLVEDAIFKFSFELADEEELQIDRGAVPVTMAKAGDVAADRGVNAKLFVEFTGEGDFRRLTGFDLAAGKLPLQAHGLVGPPLADEHLARAGNLFTQDECSHNVADCVGR